MSSAAESPGWRPLALTRRGRRVEALERAPERTEVGAGLSVWPNAMRRWTHQVGGPVRPGAVLQEQAGIRDATGRWLSRSDTAELERRYGPTAMIHRADLFAVLRAVPGEVLRPGTTVTIVRLDRTVLHARGECRADLVVSAGGVHSITRQSLWPGAPAPRYVGYTAWRLVTPPGASGRSGGSDRLD